MVNPENNGGNSDRGSIPRLLSVRQILLIFMVFLAAAYGLHFLGFNSPMVYDSGAWIEQKAYVFATHDPLQVISIVPVRPLFMISLYFNYMLTGMDPYFFRLLNSMLLATTGLALALLLITILEIPDLNMPLSAQGKRWIAVFLAILFVVHPLQSFVVLYIWQREAILACLFYFATLATYLGARSGHFSNPLSGYVLTATLFLAGLLSKENLLTLPLIMGLAEITLLRQGWRQLVKRGFVLAALTVPPVIVYLAVTYMLHGTESQHAQGVLNRLAGHYAYSGLTPLQVLLTESRVFFSYVQMILAPNLDGLEFSRVEVVSSSLFDPPITAFACAGVIVLLALAAGMARKRPLISFGFLFFTITLMPESLLIPQYLFFGYRAVLPMAGILIILADLAPRLIGWMAQRTRAEMLKPAMAVAAICILVYPSAVTLSQAKKWTPLNFWKSASDRLPPFSAHLEAVPYLDIAVNSMLEHINAGLHNEAIDIFRGAAGVTRVAAEHSEDSVDADKTGDPLMFQELAERLLENFPDKPERTSGVLLNLGVALAAVGQLDAAIDQYKRSIQLNPGLATTYVNLGAAVEATGNPLDAMQLYAKAIEIDQRLMPAYNCLAETLARCGYLAEATEVRKIATDLEPHSGAAWSRLALAYHQSGDLFHAVQTYRRSLDLDPRNADTLINLGHVFIELADAPAAVREFAKAVELNPHSLGANLNLAFAFQESGNLADAVQAYKKALAIDPNCVTAHNNLALAMRNSDSLSEAINHARKAVEIAPHLVVTHNNLGLALDQAGYHAEALAVFNTILEIDPYLADAHCNIGAVLRKSGRMQEALAHYGKAIEIDPYAIGPYMASGRILEELGDLPEALTYYRDASDLFKITSEENQLLDSELAQAHRNIQSSEKTDEDSTARVQ